MAATLAAAAMVVAMSLAAAPSASAGTMPTTVTSAASVQTPRLTKLVAMARKMTTMNIPYSHGGHGSSPAPIGASVDCSGLVRQLYAYAFGVDIGQGSGDQMVRTSGLFTRTHHPVPGDVMLVGHGGHAPAYHAMIYVGNDDGHPTGVGSPDFGYVVEYQHPWTRYWAGDVMGFWHYNGASRADSEPFKTHVEVTSRTQHGRLITLRGTAYDTAAPTRLVKVSLYVGGKLYKSVHTKARRFTVAFHADNGGHSAKVVAYPASGSNSAKSTDGSCAPFRDVQASNPHCWNITWLADRGVTKPAGGRYHPAEAVNRGAMAAFLFRIVNPGKPAPRCNGRPFPDVPTSGTFCGYIAWAKHHGVSVGYRDGGYHPASAVTRGAMAAFLHRIATDKTAPDCRAKPFTDVSTGSTFCGVIAWAKRHGITYGYGGGRFGTGDPVSRQSMASFLRRIAPMI